MAKKINSNSSSEIGAENGKGNTNSPESSLLKFLPLAYHHSHFLDASLNLTSFFTMAFFRTSLFYTAVLFWIMAPLKSNPTLTCTCNL